MANISNTTSNTIITGTRDADILINFGDNVTIDGGAGNDHLKNSGSNVKITGGSGDDYIFNIPSSNVSIDGGDGDDNIFSNGSNTYVVGGNGADLIESSGNLVQITVSRVTIPSATTAIRSRSTAALVPTTSKTTAEKTS